MALLECSSCKLSVGIDDEKLSCIKLYKWSVALQRSKDAEWETNSVQTIVSAQLLAWITEQATYKVLAFSGVLEDAEEALLVSEGRSHGRASMLII